MSLRVLNYFLLSLYPHPLRFRIGRSTSEPRKSNWNIDMAGRMTRMSVTFSHPFSLADIGAVQPAGTYRVQTVDVSLDDLSFCCLSPHLYDDRAAWCGHRQLEQTSSHHRSPGARGSPGSRSGWHALSRWRSTFIGTDLLTHSGGGKVMRLQAPSQRLVSLSRYKRNATIIDRRSRPSSQKLLIQQLCQIGEWRIVRRIVHCQFHRRSSTA